MAKKFSPEQNNSIIADSYTGDSRKEIEKRHSASGGTLVNSCKKKSDL